MTDHDLEQRLSAWYQADIRDERAPQQLRADLATLVQTDAHSRRPLTAGWRFPRMNRFAPVAIAATAVVVAILIGIGLVFRAPDVGPSPIPGPTHSATQEPRPPSVAPVPAAWTATGSMTDARLAFTATLLLDGRVLVTGGDRGYDALPRALASAELYDPATGTWSATGSMLTGRYRHTATLLPDGKVLVAGGNVSSSAQLGSQCCLATAELYDPATGKWTATASMKDARVGFTATLLLDGTVLVAGGDNALVDGNPPGAELYDPSTASWTATGAIGYRHDHTATLLHDGRVLLIGGSTASAPSLYDPGSRSWSETQWCVGLIRPDCGTGPSETATLLPDGSVLVAGGAAEHVEVQPGSFEWRGLPYSAVYHPASETWTATGDMTAVRSQFTATLLTDGIVLVVGGHAGGYSYDPLAGAELYDPGTGTWTATASMVEGRYAQQAVLLLDGSVLVVGGTNAFVDGIGFVPVSSAELYDPGNGS